MSRVGSFLGKLFAAPASAGNGNSAPLRAYGKLPMYAEYRRLEVSPGTPTAYSQWMDAGRLAWMQAAGTQHGAAGLLVPSRLMLQLPGLKEVVIASIWDSRDTVGRIFPFSFFASCPLEALGRHALERQISAAWIHDQLDRAYAEMRVLGSGGDFYRHYRGRTVSLHPDDAEARAAALLEQAGQIDAPAWFEASGLSPALPPADWFASLARRAAAPRGQPADLALLALACPLAPGIAFDAQAMLWLRWIDPLAQLVNRAPWSIAPGARDGPGHFAYFLLRDLMPGDFQLLTSHAAGYGFVENLTHLPNSAATIATAATATPVVTAQPVGPPSGPMLDWLMTAAGSGA